MCDWDRGVDRAFRLHPDGVGEWYHGTTEHEWELIKAEGVLWGKEVWTGFRGSETTVRRLTYLTPCPRIAKKFAGWGNCSPYDWEVVLAVNFNPSKYSSNMVQGCWQVRVYDPIPLSEVRVYSVSRSNRFGRVSPIARAR